MGKRQKQQSHNPAPQQPEYDQFSLQEEPQKEPQKHLTIQKPMQQIFAQILQQQQQKKVKKQKRIKKQANQKKVLPPIKSKSKLKSKEIEEENDNNNVNVDTAFKYVSNASLEDTLRTKTLNGVVKVLNLISAHQKQEGAHN